MIKKSSIGLQLISSIIKEGDVESFVKLCIDTDYLRPTELELHGYIKNFIHDHGTIPKMATVENQFEDLILPKAIEPASFYADKVKDRYFHNALKQGFDEAKMFLTKENMNPGQAIEMLTGTLTGLTVKKYGTQLVDFRHACDIITKEYKEKMKFGDDYGINTGWDYLDKMTGGLMPGDVISIVGRPACLSGDTKLYISRKSKGSGRYYTLKEVYRGMHGKTAKQGRGARKWDLSIPTRVQSLMDDDLTGLNIVEDIVYSGKKETYTVTTESGKVVRATTDHMFMTPNGFRPLGDLVVGDEVICKAPDTGKGYKQTGRYRKEICTKMPYAPYPTRVINGCVYHRVLEQRANYDAALNGVNLQDFIQQLKTNPNHGFVFSESSLHIHHKDEDTNNNAVSNLGLLTNSEHGKEHGAGMGYEGTRSRFGQNLVHAEKIISIELFGMEDTYDLVCADPYNNFIAEGFVTHNSGKTFLLLFIMHYIWSKMKRPTLLVSMEMTPLPLIQRVAAMHTHKPLTHIKQAALSTAGYKQMTHGLKLMEDHPVPCWIVDGNLTATVEDIWALCKQLKPGALIIDGAYLLKHPDKRMNKFARIDENAELIKQALATDLGIPTICSYQFNRDAAKKMKASKGEDIGLEDIGYSDAIGQLSTIVLGLLEEESIATKMQRKVNILKGRNGEVGGFNINWDFNLMNFQEVMENTDDMLFLD
jgi:replicative DNA helicase